MSNPEGISEDDLWEEKILPHLPEAWRQAVSLVERSPSPADVKRMRERFLAGNREHGGDIWDWIDEQFPPEIQSEADDLVIYFALWKAVRAYRQEKKGLTKEPMS